LGALVFDSPGFAAAAFEPDGCASDADAFESDDDLVSFDFDSLPDLASRDELESPLLLPSDEPDEAAAPSPLDADFLDASWSFFPSLP